MRPYHGQGQERDEGMNKDKRILILGSLAAVLLLLTGGLWLSRDGGNPGFADCRKSTIAGGFDRLGGPFTLTDQHGARVTEAQVFAKPSLLYFGYTYCPDICPLDAARNAEAASILEAGGIEVTPVFISVDPKRDTPPVLNDFAQAMHERMIALTGTPEEIAAVSKSWGNYYRINDQDDPENYLVDHMTNTYLVMPGGGAVELFDRNLAPQDMANQTACFINAAKRI